MNEKGEEEDVKQCSTEDFLALKRKSNRDSIFKRMTLQIFPFDCFQDNTSVFSELLLEEGAKDVKRIGHRGDGDNFILYFYLMSVQGIWMHKSNSKANYKMTGMSLY